MNETPSKSPFSMYVLHDLTQLLLSIKEAFLDPRTVRALIDHLNYSMDKVYFFHLSFFVLFYILPVFKFSTFLRLKLLLLHPFATLAT